MGKQKRNKNQLSKSSPRTESNDAIKFSKITMKDLEEISSDEDDGEMPPEELWGDDAKALKRAIEGGAFDKLLTNTQDDNDEEFEDIEMDDEDETKDEVSNIDSDDSEGVEQKEIRDEVQINSERAIDSKLVDQDQQINTENRMEDEKEDDAGDNDENQSLTTDNQQNCLTENDSGSKNALSQENSNVSTKAMRFVTDSLQAEKRGWPWAETFDIIVPTPLPFGDDELADNQISVHDDLKREVAFYDIALTAVLDAKKKCLEAGIPFTRPDDFFAEMVKSDGMSTLSLEPCFLL
jgi:rRNA-processing protein EBP2